MDKYRRANQNLWNEKTAIHAKSDFYDVEAFKAGKSRLNHIELEELGDVNGKSLLHLQCHFGLDSMGWARLGARVTGVDFSDKSIALARELNTELGLDCEFVLSDIMELPDKLSGQFDIVFTSYGVLVWLPEIKRWGEVVGHFLKPGGTFYIVEYHPSAMVFDMESKKPELRATYPYFHSTEPLLFHAGGSYAEPDATFEQAEQFEWSHSMGDIMNALIDQGLHIEFLHEYAYCDWQMFPFLEKRGDYYHLPEGLPKVPLMFSLKATKHE
ncbi:MAG: class I SAM-dependent methyltransferase [Chloroflexi bacterium]|nr:MAG: class I SAM-dependent methyltransferase [Chloroflexota bacterium]MBL1193295.1 class I SAM-dependent methyltransferase [Chloroflexota bacterium]NOH10587.1 class I SAM-dependent methyltransferase [Chloroflexota bacterium]